MKVAFVSENAQNDTKAFSGAPYFMSNTIRSKVQLFDYIYAPMFDWEAVFSNPEKALKALKETGQSVSKQLKALAADVVICQGTSMIPFLDTAAPVVLWHDSTWDCLLQLDFEEFKSCHPLLWEWDRMVFDKCNLIAFAADWLRDAAVARYKVDAGKIVVVPFGANIEPRPFHEVDADIRARKGERCQLTLLGRDWIRKGGPAAYSLMDRLNREDCPTTLNAIGGDALKNTPSDAANLFGLRVRGDKRVDVAGFLDKSRRPERDRLFRILAQTHFLIHPAEFECFGIALAEANAFGVPVLAVDKFGPKTIIRNAVNGHLFPSEDFVTEASRFILDLQRNFDDYQKLAQTAFAEYQSRLNWDVSVKRLLNAINQL